MLKSDSSEGWIIMKDSKRKRLCRFLFVFFIFSQVVFLNHQQEHFADKSHEVPCVICILNLDISYRLSEKIHLTPSLEKSPSFKLKSFCLVKNRLYSPYLPRSPPQAVSVSS